MANRNPNAAAPEILLPLLQERGFEDVQPQNIIRVLKVLEYTYDRDRNAFYDGTPVGSEIAHGGMPIDLPRDESHFMDVPSVAKEVAAYLLSNPIQTRFLPDPAEPVGDLVAEREKKEQKRLRSETLEKLFKAVDADFPLDAREELGRYVSLLQQDGLLDTSAYQAPGVPDLDDYVQRLVDFAVPLRGVGVLAKFATDLDRVAEEGMPLAVSALLTSASHLYTHLSPENAARFVDQGISHIRSYLHPEPGLDKAVVEKEKQNIVPFFLVKGLDAEVLYTGLLEGEHRDVVEKYARTTVLAGKKTEELDKAKSTLGDLEKRLGDEKAAHDALKIVNDKNIQDLVDAGIRKRDLGEDYAELHEDYAKLQDFQGKTKKDLQHAKKRLWVTGIESVVGGAFLGALAVAYFGLVKPSYNTKERPRPAETQRYEATTPGTSPEKSEGHLPEKMGKVPLPPPAADLIQDNLGSLERILPRPAEASPSYDPRGKSATELIQYTDRYIGKRLRKEGRFELGPGCSVALEQLYHGMDGVPEGKQYFLDNMRRWELCVKVSDDEMIPLGR